MNKKLLLSLGSIAAISPVIAVVACGKIQEPTSEQLDQYRKLTTAESTRLLEEKWDEQVLSSDQVDASYKIDFKTIFAASTSEDTAAFAKTGQYKLDITKNAKLKSAAQYIIKQEIVKDKMFLNKIATNLYGDRVNKWAFWNKTENIQSTDKVDLTYLTSIGLARPYEYQKIEFYDAIAQGKLADEAINILLNYSKSDFRLKVYKQLVAEAYLLSVNNAEYSAAFVRDARNFTLVQKAIKDEDFALINEMISQRLFAQWNVTLSETSSTPFIGEKYATTADALAALNITTGELALTNKYSARKIAAYNEPLLATGYDQLVGWKGYTAQAIVPESTKSSILNFSRESLEKVTKESDWTGFVQENTLVTKDIKLIADEAKVVNVTYVQGIMPIFDAKDATTNANGTNKFILGTTFDTPANKEALVRLFAYKDTSLYSKASQYFRTKADNKAPIILDIKQEDVKNIYSNQNFEFIKERKAE